MLKDEEKKNGMWVKFEALKIENCALWSYMKGKIEGLVCCDVELPI